MLHRHRSTRVAVALALLVLAACGGGGTDDDAVADRSTTTRAPSTSSTEDAPWQTNPPGSSARVGRLEGWLGVDAAQPVVVGTIGPDGGDVVATAGPLEGLRISAAPGAYPEPVDLAVTAGEIVDWSYGTAIAPISPLITVDGPDVLADGILEVTVPAEVPDGALAMGVLWDPATTELEPLPVVEVTDESVTVATRHFSSFFLTLVDLAGLPDSMATGFVPAQDMWQFPNYGAYIEPGGICAGMSLTSMWYFLEVAGRDAAAPRLYGTYDNDGLGGPPDFWYDDAHGIRFASVIQHDVDWASLVRDVSRTIAARGHDDLQLAAIRYAMYLTGEPQYVAIADANGENGHALVAYAVSPNEVWVADPNHATAARSIRMDPETSTWLPYSSGPDADAIAAGRDVAYTRVAYVAKSALVGWDVLADRFQELEAGTIGDGVFPAVNLRVEVQAAGGATSYPKLPVSFSTDQAQVWVSIDGPGTAYLFEGTSTTAAFATVTNANLSRVDLQPGENVLRAAFLAPVGGRDEYVDFQTYVITRAATTTTTVTVTVPPTVTTTTLPSSTCDCAPDDALCWLDCEDVPDVPSQPPGA